MRIIVDIDDTIANFIPEVIRWYNLDWDDNLKIEQITEWNIVKFIKPVCGVKFYDYFKMKEIYNRVEPIEYSLFFINQLREDGHEIYFCTSTPHGAEGMKFNWLIEHGFLEDTCQSKKYYVEINDKSILRADLIIDDGYHNVENFQGYKILFEKPWNEYQFAVTNILMYRTNDWESIYSFITKINKNLKGSNE